MVALGIHSTFVCVQSLATLRITTTRMGMGLGSLTAFQWPFLWLSICLSAVNLWQFCQIFWYFGRETDPQN